jgi:hypothetical protein
MEVRREELPRFWEAVECPTLLVFAERDHTTSGQMPDAEKHLRKAKSVRTAWRATCRRAGIENLRFHDLRREFGSRVLESGSSLVEARDLLGHANISQTSTYLQSTAKTLGVAIESKEAAEQTVRLAREQRQAREAQPEQPENCHTNAECDNGEQADPAQGNGREVVN